MYDFIALDETNVKDVTFFKNFVAIHIFDFPLTTKVFNLSKKKSALYINHNLYEVRTTYLLTFFVEVTKL